jgi:hypothetical protein
MRLSFGHGFNASQIHKGQRLRDFRVKLGGTAGLARDSRKIISKEIKKAEAVYSANPEEIMEKKTVDELVDALDDKNSLAKPWWDEGDNANVGDSADRTDEELVLASRANAKRFKNRLTPAGGEQVVELKSIKQLLLDRRDADARAK